MPNLDNLKSLQNLLACTESPSKGTFLSPIRDKIRKGNVMNLKSMFEKKETAAINAFETMDRNDKIDLKRLVKSSPKPITPGRRRKTDKKKANIEVPGLKQSLIRAYFLGLDG